MKSTVLASAWMYWSAATLLSALLTLVQWHLAPEVSRWEGALGWLLAAGVAATGYLLLPHALGTDSTRFLVFGLVGQLVRLGLLLTLFAYVILAKNFSFLGFVSCGVMSYGAHLFAEVAWLARRSANADLNS